MTRDEFEAILDSAVSELTEEARQKAFESSPVFEHRVREVLERHGLPIDYDPHPYAFPDIAVGEFGVEVKFTTSDSWRSVANSVFETYRREDIVSIYVVYGKMGGFPEVRWDRYDHCVIHVRTSHVPRFELEIGAESSLFDKFGVSYEEFSKLDMSEKMEYIRQYARERLEKGDRLWWLEDKPDEGHSLPIQARLYMSLPQDEKRRLRAEAALLCPQIVRGSRQRDKYNDAGMFLLTYHGVFAPQTRDLFSAGSVAGPERGGIYVLRALEDIQDEMRETALRMDDALFVEYWGESCLPEDRIREWLRRADELAVDWRPSHHLFREET